MKLPQSRWRLAINDDAKIAHLCDKGIPQIIAPLLINRGITDYVDAHDFLNPGKVATKPIAEFSGLNDAVNWLSDNPGLVGICGDYDADGMTSTALLSRAFDHLGIPYIRYIPDRLAEGYGISEKIVRFFATQQARTIITVDNGISANIPIALAKKMGLQVIVADHHELPVELPDAIIINPKLLPQTSVWRGLAGVGVAYILAISLAIKLEKTIGLADQLLELFTIGTIADMVPLIGANRQLVYKGLKKMANPKIAGLQALIEVANIQNISATDIGFKIAPFINAVGRIGDPKLVLELLTAPTIVEARPLAEECLEINAKRQELCADIESEAVAVATTQKYREEKILLLYNSNWHLGIIGIAASRLVEKFNVPVFLITQVGDVLKGSARGIINFDIFDALKFSQNHLLSWGGHKKAGGFSLELNQLNNFRRALTSYAAAHLSPDDCIPTILIDTHIHFSEINLGLIEVLQSLEPWGIENQEPIFWSENCRILEQKRIKGNHKKLWIQHLSHRLGGIAWRWGDYELPEVCDLAYKIKLNHWNEKTSIQLEIIGARIPQPNLEFEIEHNGVILKYNCWFDYAANELVLINNKQQILFISPGASTGFIGIERQKIVDLNNEFFTSLVDSAYKTIGIQYER